MALVIVRVEVSATDADPEQVLDSGEHIVKLLVPVRGMCYVQWQNVVF